MTSLHTLPRLDGQDDGWNPVTEFCPVSIGARLIADRWTVLIVREMLMGITRFNAIHRALPALSRSLLSSRLRYLERIGVLQHAVQRGEYRLTESGLALRPVLEALGVWALDWRLPPSSDAELSISTLLWQMYQGLNREALPPIELDVAFHFPHSAQRHAYIYVHEKSSGACIGVPEREPSLTVTVEAEVLNELWWGKRKCAVAIAAGDIGFEGPSDLARAYPTWFSARP
ncbi:winged helix-turn-helix transcriptional regulator [Herbiconiux sp. YIM B11900]|uniref:winged helix-turn-helix transcriptional regulator n=1 Tax=Herbiconiux sp. YIM B11900 TaxID=3404131 RepID=UPI003F863BB5